MNATPVHWDFGHGNRKGSTIELGNRRRSRMSFSRSFARLIAFVASIVLASCGTSGQPSTGTSQPASFVPQDIAQSTAIDPSGGATLGGCAAFPSTNPWNADVSQLPVDPNSANYLAHMDAGTSVLHAGFGHGPQFGIPITLVPGSQPFVPMSFMYANQSNPGPYPFPRDVGIEGGVKSTGDRHALVVDKGNCRLYETWRTFYVGPGWHAGSGAIFDLSSNKLRPDCWTSADAAGLPIAPALPRYDEIQSGVIEHALRFTLATTQAAFVHPATHYASSQTDPNDAPMGLRVRLKANFDIASFHGASRIILTALKKYGMFVADNGSDWYITGSTDSRWNDDDLKQLNDVPARAFEVVKLGPIITKCY
ncbi:MAG: hypothetical protein IAI50_04805 [Candidatus Eremiobacteraeota bacterium]|nr:hypothetical protein [Candidatus Eremiobacteraeota bacterium]